MPSRRRRQNQEGPNAAAGGASARASGGRGNAARAASLSSGDGVQARGLWGWFQDAGAWVGEKASGAAQAASDAAHTVARTTGDLWDVATASDVDVDWGARRVTLHTDLDEVMDLMPASVQAALQLDRTSAENAVTAVYDHRAGTVTLMAEALEINSLQTDTLAAGAVSLQGVRLVLANPGGGLPFVGDDAGLPVWEDSGDNLVADLSVAGLTAQDVVVAHPAGPVRVARLALSDLQGNARDAEGGPGGEGSIAGFSVAGAILEGVQAQGTTVGRVEASNLSAGVSEPGESGYLAADSLVASGATRGDTSLGSASLERARVEVSNSGGGMPFLDSIPDTNLQASVSTHAASVTDFQGGGSRVQSASAQGVAGTVSGQAASVSARHLTGAGLDTASFDAAGGSARGVQGDLRWGEGLHAGLQAEEAGATGVTSAHGSAARVSAEGLDLLSSGGTTHLGADSLRAGGVLSRGADVASAAGNLEATGARATLGAGGLSAELDRVVGRDLSHGEFGSRQAELTNVGVSQAGGATTIDASGFALGGLSTPWMDARSLSGEQGSISLSGADMDAALERVRLEGGTIADRVGVEAATLTGLSASREGGVGRLGVASGTLSEVSDQNTGAAASSASLSGLSIGQSPGGDTTAGLDSLSVRDARVGDDLTVGHAELSGLSAHANRNGTHAALSEAQLTNLRASTATGSTQVDALSARAAAVRRDGASGALVGGVGSLDAQGVSARYAPGSSGEGSDADLAALVRSGTALVDDADLRATAMLKPGDNGWLDVPAGTHMDARLGIQDGRIVPAATEVNASNPIAGPLWTTLDGAYMTEDGKAKASVAGWADPNITGMINEATGVGGENRLGTVAQMGAGIANSLESGGSESSSSGGLVESGTAQAEGWLSLHAGTLDAGALGSATLAGDNTLSFEYGEGGLGVEADRVSLDSASSSGGSVGSTTLDGVSVTADGTGSSAVEAARIQAEDLRFGR